MEQTFLHYAKKFLIEKNKSLANSSYMNCENYINKILMPCFWMKNIEDINTEDIKNFINYLTKRYSNQTAKNIYSILKQILDLAVMDGVIETNYARLFKIESKKENKINNSKDIVLTDFEINRVCDYCKKSLSKGGIGVIISLKTGARKGEVISLRWDDINLNSQNPCINIKSTVTRYRNKKGIISYQIGKTKTKFSKRSIPLNNKLKQLLEDYRQEYKIKFSLNDKELNKCFLIPNKNPTDFISPNKLDYYFRKLKKECKLNEKIKFHSLRHTFITKSTVEKNIPLSIVKYLVGHSTSTSITVDTYTHINQDDVNNYRDKL